MAMQGFLVSHAIYAIVIFGVLEAMCIPISSELTFLLGGAIASGAVAGAHQHLSLALVIILGTLAEMVGSFIAYEVGRAGGRPLVHRVGKYVLVTQHDVDRAERFLVGRGAWALPVARMLPLIRAFASIVAGVVEVPRLRFWALNLIGTLVYVVALSSAGYSLGGEWTKFNKTFSDASYVVVGLVVIALAVVVFHRLREFRKESAYAAKHGGTSHTGSDRQRSGRLYGYRAGRGHAGSHRHTGGNQRDLSRPRLQGSSSEAEVGQFEDRSVRESPAGDRRAGSALH
jgi:membrane protein DedA with SNARE-associated domain